VILRLSHIKDGLYLQRTLELEYGFTPCRSLAQMVTNAEDSGQFSEIAIQQMRRIVMTSNSGRHRRFNQTKWQHKVVQPPKHDDVPSNGTVTKQALPQALKELNPQTEDCPMCIVNLPGNSQADPWWNGPDPWIQQSTHQAEESTVTGMKNEIPTLEQVADSTPSTPKLSPANAIVHPTSPTCIVQMHLDELIPDTPVLQKDDTDDEINAIGMRALQAKLNQVEIELARKSRDLNEVRTHTQLLSCQPRSAQQLKEDLLSEIANHPQTSDMSHHYIECVGLLMPQIPRSLDKQMVSVLGILHMKEKAATLQWEDALETLQDEIDDLKVDRTSATEASKKQVETAKLIQAQVDTKIQLKTNELQQRLLEQHVQHQADISTLKVTMKSFEQMESENETLKLINEQLRMPVVEKSSHEVQTTDSFLMEQFLMKEDQKANPIVDQIGHLLRTHDAKMYAKLPQLLHKYMGKERMLLDELCRKFLGQLPED
jgi:hypothetical protein